MGSPALGSLGLALEPQATPGELVNILAYSAVAATASAANQPSYSTGSRLHIYVYGNTATGTVTVAGKDINGNAATETTPTIPIMVTTGQNQEVSKFDYVTTATYASINTSGITTTGLTNSNIKIGQMPSAKVLLPATVSIEKTVGDHSPVEFRALPDLHTHEIQTSTKADVTIEQTLYPDSSMWAPYMIMNSATNPTTPTTTPGSATVLLAATAVSGSPLSLTTQPTAPGMRLILVIVSASVLGTVVIAGTDARTGEAVTETIAGSTNGTFYSANTYSGVNASGLTITGFTSATLAITGVFGWNRTFIPSLTPQSASVEFYTGTDSVIAPYTCLEELTFEFDSEKDLKVTSKGIAQDRLIIGNRTTNPMSTSQVNTLAQPMDPPLAGWQCQVYLDPLTNAAGTTIFGDMISGKISIKVPLKEIYKLDGNQYFNIVYRKKISIDFEGKIDYTNVLQMEAFRQNTKQYLYIIFTSRTVGAGAQQSIAITIPLKILKFPVSSKPDGDYVEASISGIGEYDPGIGGSYKLVWANSQMPPNFNL